MAFPQRIDSKTIDTLPVDDITLPDPEVTGIIVDNWAPRIAEISLIENDWQTIRWGQYETNEPNNQYTGRTLSYIHPYGTFPYITTGSGINEYELEIHYSEPVKSLTPNITVTIKMVTGPDSTVNWNDSLNFVLDTLCYNANGECTVATYYATGYQPPGYVGHQIVEMTITDEFACDLAENGLDADASTIAPAWGEGGSDNYENTFDFVEDLNSFYGYYREESIEQDPRSRVIYACYDRIYIPTDDRDSLVWIKNDFTLTGALYDAELFNEVNWMGLGNNRCIIYGGTWMCDNDDDVLHLYVVDYQGTIKKDEVFFDPDSSEYADIVVSEVTTPSYWSGNPYEDPILELDRYGWLGWRKVTPFSGDNSREESNNREDSEEMYLPQGNRNVPEDFESDNREDVYRRDVEISYTVCDAYTWGVETQSLVNGHQWFNTDEYKWYITTITGMSGVGNDGEVSITTRTYNYPDTNPEYRTDTLPPPGVKSCNSLHSDRLFETGITSQGIEISDYFSVFPNPARGSVSIEFMTSIDVSSTVRIYDISGHLVRIIAEGLPGLRNYNLLWDLQDANGRIVPTGIYYVSLVSDSFEKTRTVIVCQ